MKTVRLAGLFALTAALASAQVDSDSAPLNSVSFSAVSVRPAVTNVQMESGGPGTPDPGQMTYTAVPLRRLVMVAWGLTQPFQVSAPRWLDDERYDVVVTFPPESSQDQFRAMLRHLLTERFALLAHPETREMAGDELSVAKGGLKMKESSESETRKPALSIRAMRPGVRQLTGRLQTISDIAEVCMKMENRPVVDKTGLGGKYDFVFAFAFGPAPAGASGAGDPAPDLAAAMQDSLGLKLDVKTLSYDVLVVSRAEKEPAGK